MSSQFNIDNTWAIDDENVLRPIEGEAEFGGGLRS
jgi:hypothetical protein